MTKTSMKPLLAVCLKEAVRLALIDSCVEPPKDASDAESQRYEARKEELGWDIYKLSGDELAGMDPMALAQNVAWRLFGTGGWEVNGAYAGNSTPQAILEAFVHRPDQNPLGILIMDMGLNPLPGD